MNDAKRFRATTNSRIDVVPAIAPHCAVGRGSYSGVKQIFACLPYCCSLEMVNWRELRVMRRLTTPFLREAGRYDGRKRK